MKLRKTIYFSEETWKLLQEFNYRYGWKESSNSDLLDYIFRSFLSAEKKR